MSLSARWNETNLPSSPLEFWSVRQQLDGTSTNTPAPQSVATTAVLQVGSLNAADWSPAEPGLFYVWARATNSLGQLKETSWSPITVHAANDGFTRAAVIPASARSFEQTFNLQWSSAEANEPVPLTGLGGQTLWWRWTPDYSGLASLRATQDTQDQTLEVFMGQSLTKLKRVAGTPGSVVGAGVPTLAWLKIKRGQTYFVRISRYAPSLPSLPGYGAFTFSQPDTTLAIVGYDVSKPNRLGDIRVRPVALSFFGKTRRIHGRLVPQIEARVSMPDGSYVADSRYRAQLYVGTSAGNLQPVGTAQKFFASGSGQSNPFAGTIIPTTVVVSGYAAWQPLVARVKVWDSTAGNNYESAVGRGLTGESALLEIKPGARRGYLDQLQGLTDFSLKPGNVAFPDHGVTVQIMAPRTNLAVFPLGWAAATLSFAGDQSQMRWRLTSPGGRYAIEAKSPDSGWETILVLTNTSRQVEFVDPRSPLPPASIYRARQLQ